MKKEYWLVFIGGMFLLAYVLDAVVNPLDLDLATPYHFLTPKNITTYPFTTASVVVKALGMFLIPLWLFSFFEHNYSLKGGLLLVLIALMQLYSLQEIATGTQIVPLEWALSISMAGLALFIPMTIYILRGLLYSAHQKLAGATGSDAPDLDQDEEPEEVNKEEE
jgi:hypothetical protein